MKVWTVNRAQPTLGQKEHVGYFRSRKRAMDAALVTISNDHSDNQRWPELQRFWDVDVTIDELKRCVTWLTTDRGKLYIVASHDVK